MGESMALCMGEIMALCMGERLALCLGYEASARAEHVHSTPDTQHRCVGGTTHDTPGPVQVRGPDDGDGARTEPGANPAILGPVCATTQQGVMNSLTSTPYAHARRTLNEARALHYRVVTRRGL